MVYGERATFFVVEDELSPSAYAELVDITFENSIKISELESKSFRFLSLNALTVEQIDAVVLGFNGDVETDLFYKESNRWIVQGYTTFTINIYVVSLILLLLLVLH